MSRGQVVFMLSKATALARKRREREALERSFKRLQIQAWNAHVDAGGFAYTPVISSTPRVTPSTVLPRK
jgi:hypothetical protein